MKVCPYFWCNVPFKYDINVKIVRSSKTTFYLSNYQILYTGWKKAENDLPVSTLHNLLKYHVCMRSSVSKEMLQYLSDNASNPNESCQLKRLATNRREYNLWKQDHLGIIDVFRKFPSIMVDASGLIYRLKPLQPR